MQKEDRLKAIIAISLFGSIAISYWLYGKTMITKAVVLVTAAIWLITMYILKKK